MRFVFKESPFFKVHELLLGNIPLDGESAGQAAKPANILVSPSHRQNVTRSLQLSAEQCQRIKGDQTLRIFLFSAADDGLGPYARHDIAFPSQIEVKINGDEVRANFKGLKNKP
jgi:E3 SUMO-protein ligase PIAS1